MRVRHARPGRPEAFCPECEKDFVEGRLMEILGLDEVKPDHVVGDSQ